MAKKGQTKKKTEQPQVVDIEQIAENVEIPLDIVESVNREKNLESLTIEELMWVEKACALLCKKYETSARIDFENNKKLGEFTQYYNKIIGALEKQVSNICTIK